MITIRLASASSNPPRFHAGDATDDDGPAGCGKTSSKVLVVEDEAIIALDLARQLQDMGLEVVGIAGNGEAALALACQHDPDVITMDIVIRGPIDGIETARRLRTRSDIPVVYLTAYDDEETRRRAAETSPSGYLRKPMRAEELRTTLCGALRKRAAGRGSKPS